MSTSMLVTDVYGNFERWGTDSLQSKRSNLIVDLFYVENGSLTSQSCQWQLVTNIRHSQNDLSHKLFLNCYKNKTKSQGFYLVNSSKTQIYISDTSLYIKISSAIFMLFILHWYWWENFPSDSVHSSKLVKNLMKHMVIRAWAMWPKLKITSYFISKPMVIFNSGSPYLRSFVKT